MAVVMGVVALVLADSNNSVWYNNQNLKRDIRQYSFADSQTVMFPHPLWLDIHPAWSDSQDSIHQCQHIDQEDITEARNSSIKKFFKKRMP